MRKIESYASDHARLWFVLTREGVEGETERDASRELVVSISALCGEWISPLTAAVRVESRDPSHYYLEDSAHPPAHPAWFLRRHELDARLFFGPVWLDSQERYADRIEAKELSSLVEEALAQPPPTAYLEVSVAEVVIDATEVALPDGLELSLRYDGGPIESIQIRDGHRWLALGPDTLVVGPPARLHASNQHGVADIHVEFFWDFWSEHPEGLAQARDAIARVLARGRGWQITEGNLPAQP